MSGRENQAGLPGPLPEGEVVLWEGAPDRAALLRHVLPSRLLLGYFGLAALGIGGTAILNGWSPGATVAALAVLAVSAAIVMGLLRGYAALTARSARYTITNRRVVMRIGIALPITLNVPFTIVEGAALKRHRDGSGDIPIAIGGNGRMGFVHLWPHARPWRVSRPEPALRAVPEAQQVAAILARALGSGLLGQAAARQDSASRQDAGLAHSVAA